jgi:hypothetical protein
MEARLHIASRLLAGLICLDRTRPLSARMREIEHALQLADALIALHGSTPPLTPLEIEVRARVPAANDDDNPDTVVAFPVEHRARRRAA